VGGADDPQAFAQRWHKEVADLTKHYDYSPDAIKGFTVAEAQATQQVLATNQAFNSQRIFDERQQNISALAADALQREWSRSGGHISGSRRGDGPRSGQGSSGSPRAGLSRTGISWQSSGYHC
jgi:hypothetical protein